MTLTGHARLEADELEPLELDGTNGIYVEVLDLGFPTIRAVTSSRTDGDGEDDRTTRIGARAVTISGTVAAIEGMTRTEILDRIRAFLHPRYRPFLIFALENGDDERRISLRADQHAAPIIRPSSGTFSVGWRGPDGVQEEAVERVVAVEAAPEAEDGRTYPRTYFLTYPASSPLGAVVVENVGGFDAYPLLELYGPCTNPRIENVTTGRRLVFSLELAAGDFLAIDTREKTILYNANPASSRYDAVDFATSSWFGLVPGENLIRYFPEDFDAGAEAVIRFRSVWL